MIKNRPFSIQYSLGAGRQKNGNGLEEGLMLKYG
jgi:hypothetical protein